MALSRSEFCRLVDEHGPALYRTAVRLLGDRHEAEDVVQEAFRSAWTSRRNFRAGRSERAWMIAILRRRVADRWRKRTLPVVNESDSTSQLAARAEAPRDDYSDEVQNALALLPAELRETLLLVVVGELTHQEAADELGVPIGTVLSRVARARSRLREYLLAASRRE